VDHIHLEIGPGEFFGFLGPNGAGKSTTIRMLTGMLRPSSGQIQIMGHDMENDRMAVRSVIGVLEDEPALYERLSPMEMLAFSAQMYGLPASEGRKRAKELLDLMELSDSADKLIVDFSLGMKKKVALAAAVIHSPRVLFLDEPFNGIDALSARTIREMLMRMTRSGATIFFSSHVLEVVEKLCTRVAIIARGRIAAEGSVDELKALADNPNADLEEIFVDVVGKAQGGAGYEAHDPSTDLTWLDHG